MDGGDTTRTVSHGVSERGYSSLLLDVGFHMGLAKRMEWGEKVCSKDNISAFFVGGTCHAMSVEIINFCCVLMVLCVVERPFV